MNIEMNIENGVYNNDEKINKDLNPVSDDKNQEDNFKTEKT